MTIGRVTSTPVHGITSQELHATLDELLEQTKELQTSIGELDRSVDTLGDSMDARKRSRELLERQMKESLRFKLFSANDSENVKTSESCLQTPDAILETFSSKFFSFFRNIWNFFTFKREE